MKELSFEEVVVNIKPCETYVCTDKVFVIEEVTKSSNGTINLVFGDGWHTCVSSAARFVKKNKAVSFEEALESGKRVRVTHEIFNKEITKPSDCDEEVINDITYSYHNGKYVDMSDMMSLLGWNIPARDIKDVIKNGKWYTED